MRKRGSRATFIGEGPMGLLAQIRPRNWGGLPVSEFKFLEDMGGRRSWEHLEMSRDREDRSRGRERNVRGPGRVSSKGVLFTGSGLAPPLKKKAHGHDSCYQICTSVIKVLASKRKNIFRSYGGGREQNATEANPPGPQGLESGFKRTRTVQIKLYLS